MYETSFTFHTGCEAKAFMFGLVCGLLKAQARIDQEEPLAVNIDVPAGMVGRYIEESLHAADSLGKHTKEYFCLSQMLPIVADSIETLRRGDVFRLLDNIHSAHGIGTAHAAAEVVRSKRPELTSAIDEALLDLD